MMGLQNENYRTLEVVLTGTNNRTLKGVLNFTAVDLGDYSEEEEEIYDSQGAATFVVVVILVYGISIVLMIASLVKKNMKLRNTDLEEKQIHKYLDQASDLKDKSARDNYRQLKRDIINLVNKNSGVAPKGPSKSPIKTIHNVASVGNNLMSVGSPTAAEVVLPKTTPEPEKRGSVRSDRMYSDTDSLCALIEEGESLDDEPFPPPQLIKGPPKVDIKPLPMPAKHSIVFQYDAKSPRTSLASHTSSVPNIQDNLGSKDIPTVIISRPDNGKLGKSRPPPINIQTPHNTVVCDMQGNTLDDTNPHCTVSMDTGGDVWILQRSPSSGHHTLKPVPPSPSISTPGSIGYESLGTSRSPSPSPVTKHAPDLDLPNTGTRSRQDKQHSPSTYKHRDRSHSPLDTSQPKRDSRHRSRSRDRNVLHHTGSYI